MSSQANSRATVSQSSTAKCENCRRDRKKCLKGVTGMTRCKRCSFHGFHCSRSLEPSSIPAIHNPSVSKKLSLDTTRAEPATQIEKVLCNSPSPSVENISSERNKHDQTQDEIIEAPNHQDGANRSNTQDVLQVSSKAERRVLQQSREFVKQERERIVEKKRKQASQDRDTKLQDLKRFAQNFSWSSPVPTDIVSILAKDPEKQQRIVDKAKLEHEKAKTSAAKIQTVADESNTPVMDPSTKPIFSKPPKKSANIIIKNAAGEVLDFGKESSSVSHGPASMKTDNVSTSQVRATSHSTGLSDDWVGDNKSSESLGERAAHTPISQPAQAPSSSPNHAFVSHLSAYDGSRMTPYNAIYMPMTSCAEKLNMLFSLGSLTTNHILRRNIDFDGYISISVLIQYKMQLGLPLGVDAHTIVFAARYYCQSIECGGADPVIRCCLRLRNLPASMLDDHSQRMLEFPCHGRGKHVPNIPIPPNVSGQNGGYSVPPPPRGASLYGSDAVNSARYGPPYGSYTTTAGYRPSMYAPNTSKYTAFAPSTARFPDLNSQYPAPIPSTMNYASHATTNQGHTYGSTNLYNDATAVFGDIYQTHNHYSQQYPQASDTSPDQQEQFIEQVLHVAAKFGISTPQVPKVKSKDEVSRWIRDVYEAQLEASTVWGGQMSIVAPSNGTSLEPYDRANEAETCSSRAASPGLPVENQFGNGLEIDMYNRLDIPNGQAMQGFDGAAQSDNQALRDYQSQLILLKQQSRKGLLTDYQLQLILLDLQNRRRLMMAREVPDESISRITLAQLLCLAKNACRNDIFRSERRVARTRKFCPKD